jgi:formylmethanofuran dehydrogenase subunit E
MAINKRNREDQFPKVRCYKCNKKFRANNKDSKEPMFVCKSCKDER